MTSHSPTERTRSVKTVDSKKLAGGRENSGLACSRLRPSALLVAMNVPRRGVLFSVDLLLAGIEFSAAGFPVRGHLLMDALVLPCELGSLGRGRERTRRRLVLGQGYAAHKQGRGRQDATLDRRDFMFLS